MVVESVGVVFVLGESLEGAGVGAGGGGDGG